MSDDSEVVAAFVNRPLPPNPFRGVDPLTIAQFSISHLDFTNVHGVKFTEDIDDLGEYVLAFIALPSGRDVCLAARPVYDNKSELLVPPGRANLWETFLAFVSSFSIPEENVLWISPYVLRESRWLLCQRNPYGVRKAVYATNTEAWVSSQAASSNQRAGNTIYSYCKLSPMLPTRRIPNSDSPHRWMWDKAMAASF